MCTQETAERIKALVKTLPEDKAIEVLDFVEFLCQREAQENREDINEANEVLRRIDRGEEESIPWENVKAEYGL